MTQYRHRVVADRHLARMEELTRRVRALRGAARDRQESSTVVSRVDQARLDKLLAEHDPFKVDV